ncbi:hypothetical protein DSO57_1032940 [Entomophthora muscae]|uniref:Uncharacterized protein n=1 Tax=Entomophthora muscae TaxID=34485 RepID=A0ACC2RR56_9FUNG|nr:hypothetical protein DSO57_1032940 [Entomophthora muscae]
MDNVSNYSRCTKKMDVNQHIEEMSEEDKILFFSLSHKARQVLICGIRDGYTKSHFISFEDPTCTEVQKDKDLLVALKLDTPKQQPVDPQELQLAPEKRPGNKPAEPCSKKVVVAPVQEADRKQVFEKPSSPAVISSEVPISGKT